MTTAERSCSNVLRGLLHLLRLVFLLLLLQLNQSTCRCHPTIFQSSAVKARAVVIVPLPNDLTATDDDTSVTVVQWGLQSLLEAEG